MENVEDVLKEGELVKFKVVGRDPKTGKIKAQPEGVASKARRLRGAPTTGDRGDRRRDRGDRGDRRRDRGPRPEGPKNEG